MSRRSRSGSDGVAGAFSPLNSSATDTSRAFASFVMFSSEMLYSPRSTPDTYVTCKLALAANFSCERPA